MKEQAIKRAHWLLIAIGVLLAITALEQSSVWSPRPALGLENPIEARQEMVTELKKVNDRLDRLIGIFESGKVKVTVANAEELRTAGAAAPAASPAPTEGSGSKIILKRKSDDTQ